MRVLSAAATRHARRVAARAWPQAWCTSSTRASHAAALVTADDAAAALQRALAGVARPIGVRGEDVRVLASPSDYEAALLRGFATAKKRVVLASLYWGAEAPHERALLTALAAASRARPELEVTVLLDALRGTRPVPDGRGGTTSSAQALAVRSISLRCRACSLPCLRAHQPC
jgi:phosphatidylserine/phosphatidylglycerophosphate/cardiolipin synthase-like enzyme